jgi:1-phosphatidylinositol-3-phosphate 5-kinase
MSFCRCVYVAGQFLIESCFQMHDRVNNSSVMMMDHTLSFIHRPGRIDISVSKLPQQATPPGSTASGPFTAGGESVSTDLLGNAASTSQTNAALVNLGVMVDEEDRSSGRGGRNDPLKAPIYLHSYCKECKSVVTPIIEISDETWKLSFGKFIEMNFYNHSARCRTGSCSHFLRDDHILSFVCEGFMAQFEFVPIHPLSLHLRSEMPLPLSFHSAMIVNLINECVVQSARVFEDFAAVIVGLEKIVSHVLSNRPEVLKAIKNDISVIQEDIDHMTDDQADEVEAALQLILQNKTPQLLEDADYAMDEADGQHTSDEKSRKKYAKAVLIATYPLTVRRDMLQKASFWNSRINVVYRFIDSVEGMNTASSSGGGGSAGGGGVGEHMEMPDEEDLLLIRSSVMGHDDSLSDREDSRAGSTNTAGSSMSRQFLDSPRVSSGDELKSFKDEESTVMQQKSSELRHSQSEADETDLSDVTLSLAEQEEVDEKEHNQRSISAVLNANLPSATLSPTKDKSTRLTKAIQRFRGKGEHESGHTAFAVGLEELCQGRLGLPPGRFGRVVAVHEEQLATVIAYSLASEEYHENLLLLREEASDSAAAGLHSGESEKKRFTFGHSPKGHANKDFSASVKHSAGLGAGAAPGGEGLGGSSVRRREGGEDDEEEEELHLPGQEGHRDEFVDENKSGEGGGDSSSHHLSNTSGERRHTPEGFRGIKDSALDTIYEDKTPSLLSTTPSRGNVTPSLTHSSSFRNIVASDNNHQADIDHAGQEEDEDAEQAMGHKSYKYLDFNIDHDLKLEGLAPVTSASPTPSREGDGDGEDSFHQHPHPHSVTSPSSGSVEEEGGDSTSSASSASASQLPSPLPSPASRESTLISQRKTHIKHRFNDMDVKTNNISCKFICHIFYATQFQAVRAEYLKDDDDDEGFIRSLSMADQWNAQGGKSGASFSKSSDSRFVVKHITRTELQMFLDFAPAYFEYLAKSFYHGLPTLLVKILGVYQLGYHNRLTGKRVMEQVVIMENLFFDRNITRIFDLKGSSRQRYVDILGENGEKIDDFDNYLLKKRNCRRHKNSKGPVEFNPNKVCMDDNLMELTRGKPIPLKHKAKVIFHKAVMNDTLFLSIINIVDYSILVGIDEDTNELVVGIIDYMRQYDIIKRMERMGKSVGTMIAGQAEPTVIQPPQYRKRFQNAMERYFMTVPDKWIQNDI